MSRNWPFWKYLTFILVIYTVIGGFLFRIPNLPILEESIRNLYFHVPMWFGMIFLLLGSVIFSLHYLYSQDLESDSKAVELVNTGIFFGILGLVPMYNETKEIIGGVNILNDITARKNRDSILNELALGVSAAVTGEAFFISLANYVSSIFNPDFVFIGELVKPAREKMRTLVMLKKGAMISNYEYYIDRTPTELVIQKKECVFADNVQFYYPDDVFLKNENIRCYIALPLLDSSERPIGIIKLMHTEPMENMNMLQSVLRIMAKRVEAELERMGVEEKMQLAYEQLQKINFKLIEQIQVREAAELKLKKEKEFTETLIDNSIDAIVTFDNEYSIRIWNHSMQYVTGISSDEAIGKSFLDLVPQLGITEDISTLEKIFEGKKLVLENRKYANRKGFFEACFIPVYQNSETVQFALGVIHDITDLKLAEEDILRKNEELEEKVQARTEELLKINESLEGEIDRRKQYENMLREKNQELLRINSDLDSFVYTASHDLKVPIVNMESLLNWLKAESDGNTEVTEIVTLLNKSVFQLKTTIENLTTVVKFQNDGHNDNQEINLKELAQEVIGTLSNLIYESQSAITLNIPVDLKIYFSHTGLKSIFHNLLSNAIKYRSTSHKSQILVKAFNDADHLVIRVKDNGLGIDMNKNGLKIFSLFKRLHDHVEGSGIGLYLVSKIVKNNGGRIEVLSEIGKGSEFIIFLKNNLEDLENELTLQKGHFRHEVLSLPNQKTLPGSK